MNTIERFKLVTDKAEDKDLSPSTITRVCELMNYARSIGVELYSVKGKLRMKKIDPYRKDELPSELSGFFDGIFSKKR